MKIFSKKVEIKNVSSKIGSLEKAATYVPSGGNVVVIFSKFKTASLAYFSKILIIKKRLKISPFSGMLKRK